MKRFLCILLVAALALCVGLSAAACNTAAPQDKDGDATPAQTKVAKTMAEQYAAEAQDVPGIADYHTDPAFDLGTVRFAFYSPATGWVEDVNAAPFDESKPTVIHSHGQGADGYMFYPDTLYDAGYNVISFLWGHLSDDMDVTVIEQRIWSKIPSYVQYDAAGKSNIVQSTGFDCSVPELWVARYCDFFALHPNYDQPIRLSGHSYGGQLTLALAAYITTLFEANRLPANLLPERYTLLDPYFDNYPQSFECHWLDRTIDFSSVGAALYCLDNIIFPKNVAVEMLRTSNLVELGCIMGVGEENAPDYFSQMKPRMRVVELENKDALRDQFEDKIYGSGYLHTIANDFYYSPDALPLYGTADGVAVFGRESGASLVLATQGMHFDFCIDEEDYSRYQNVTVKRLTNKQFADSTVIAGIVAKDANGNGIMDEKAALRLSGVSVCLQDVDTGEKQTLDTVAGFYRFAVERGHQYTLTLTADNLQTATKTITADVFLTIADFAMGE